MFTIHIDEKVIDEYNNINLQIIKTIYKIKNDRLVIFLRGSVRCGFLTDLRFVWREKTTSIPPPIKVVSVLSSIGFK